MSNRSAPPQYTFAGGEISPLLYGRPDYQRAQSGLRTCRGFLPLRQGGLTRAPGTIHRGRTRDDASARLIAFEFAVDDCVVLEFTAGIMRVWRYGSLVMDGGDPYELALPYSLAQIRRLKYVQSADVIYLVDGEEAPRRLARRALDDWTLTAAKFELGPFEAENDDEDLTILCSAETGAATLTASGPLFEAGHVGGLFQLREVDDPDVPTWTGNVDMQEDDRVRYDGRVYELGGDDNTGVNPPTHTRGRRLASPDGPLWTYLHDDRGIVRITGVSSPTSATCQILKRVPQRLTIAGGHRWSEGSWSTKNGWPAAVAIHDQRLVLAATPASPRTLWFSAVGDFSDFEPSTEADGSFAYSIAGVESLNRIQWIQPGGRGLHVGALGEEYSSRASGSAEAIGPANAAFRTDATIGSANLQPITPDGRPIFVSRDGARAFELRYGIEEDGYAAVELSLPAEHIGTRAPFVEMAWQSAPSRVAWFRRAAPASDLVALIYDRAEDVLGWATVPLAGGDLQGLCVTRSADGSRDVVTLVVSRVIDGETLRCVEELAPAYGVAGSGDAPAEAIHLYASRLRTSDTPFSTVGSLGHLEGEEVHCWTELGELGPLTVSGGSVTLPAPVTRALVGLFDASHQAETLDLTAAIREGSSIGRQKHVEGIGLRWHRTVTAQLSVVEREFGRPAIAGEWVDVTQPSAPFRGAEAFSGTSRAPVPSGDALETSFRIRPRGGAPMTLLAAVPIMQTSGG